MNALQPIADIFGPSPTSKTFIAAYIRLGVAVHSLWREVWKALRHDVQSLRRWLTKGMR